MGRALCEIHRRRSEHERHGLDPATIFLRRPIDAPVIWGAYSYIELDWRGLDQMSVMPR
jgi:hypothetical protein